MCNFEEIDKRIWLLLKPNPNAHLHFLARKDGQVIDLRTAFEQAGLRVVRAFDGGPDGNWATYKDNADRLVTWNEDLQAWVNEAEGLVLDRGAQVTLSPGVQTEQYWLAWQDNVPLEQMQRVVFIAALSDGTKINAWLNASNYSQLWDPFERKFVSR